MRMLTVQNMYIGQFGPELKGRIHDASTPVRDTDVMSEAAQLLISPKASWNLQNDWIGKCERHWLACK